MPKGRHSTGGISNRTWIFGGLTVAGLFLLMRKAGAATRGPAGGTSPTGLLPGNAPAQPVQAGTQNIPELPGSMAVSAPTVQGAASFWDTLTPGSPPSSGYINFPSGTQAAAALFQVRNDGYGSPYVQWAGLTWILTGPDASGNYTATQVMTG